MSAGAKAATASASSAAAAAAAEPGPKTRGIGSRAPISPAVPSQEATMTALVEAAAVRLNPPSPAPAAASAPTSRVDSSGNALVAIGTASTAYGTTNTAQAKP